jgi:FkbM family methyltransferase
MFKHVYTFEPDPLNFHCLVNNCQKDNITKINAALGDRHAMVKVDRNSMNNVGTHTISSDPEKSTGLVPQLMIDDLELDNCDLIMLDVEGFEYRVLKGAVKTIEKFKPVIFAENFADGIHNTLSYFGYTHMGTSGADHIYVVA